MIKIYTSYFARIKNLDKAGIVPISIARYSPRFFHGDVILDVAPVGAMLSMNEEEYKIAYREILRKVDVNKLLVKIQVLSKGKDAALLCYEKPGDFCHRRLLAEWIEKSVGIEVPEWGISKNPKVEQLSLF